MILAPVGQFLMHAQHLMHVPGSVTTVSPTVIAAVGQTEAHFSHFMQIISWVTGETSGRAGRSLYGKFPGT